MTKIKEYGMLSGIKSEDLIAGASERVEDNDKKESSTDFALWKKTDEGIQFDSPWSKGLSLIHILTMGHLLENFLFLFNGYIIRNDLVNGMSQTTF